jgi:hypothetical protein
MIEKDELAELNIGHLVTHSKAGAVNGKMKSINGNLFAYCDVYEFSGAKGTRVREITSYVIKIS